MPTLLLTFRSVCPHTVEIVYSPPLIPYYAPSAAVGCRSLPSGPPATPRFLCLRSSSAPALPGQFLLTPTLILLLSGLRRYLLICFALEPAYSILLIRSNYAVFLPLLVFFPPLTPLAIWVLVSFVCPHALTFGFPCFPYPYALSRQRLVLTARFS